MIRQHHLLSGLLCWMLLSAVVEAADAPRSPKDAAVALVARVLPGRQSDFAFESIPADAGHDVFELETRDGKVIVRGNSALSMAFGLNWYLKYYGHCHVSLNGRQVDLPTPPPAVEQKFRKSCWAKSRYLLNYCTFSYSMSWWDWAQWERFIDWMALNGINMPLAVTGQEAVWQAVCRKFGMSDSEIESFLAGPPYLPFSWMGCLDGYGGPLPRKWIAEHTALQQRILARERELGMTPVLQGFTGHVPKALVEKFPGTKVQSIQWNDEFSTIMLDPQDPLFAQIAAAFIEEQTRLFGTDHLYDADSFIEMTPPDGDLKYVAGIAQAIYQGMAKADPKAVWLLQGWPFWYQSKYWTQERVKAFFDAVPDDRMLVLDLFCESNPVWNKTQGFCGKPWVWSFVYLFGDNTVLGSSGPLGRFNDLAAARKDPLGQKIAGAGMLMEGFGHNPLLYDLMFELGWRADVELKPWVREFARFRYGKDNADAQAAWETLRNSIYQQERDGHTIVTNFPGVDRSYTAYPSSALAKTCEFLLNAAPELGHTETYRHDLVNVARQALCQPAGELYEKMMAANRAKDAVAYRQASGAFLQLLRDLDELLATSDEFLLGCWLEDAKRWGQTDQERAKLEFNARRILTLWGDSTILRDYARKEWAGMIAGFYAKRWEIFCRRQQEALDAGRPFDPDACRAELLKFENDWARSTDAYATRPQGDGVAVARRLFNKYLAPDKVAGNLATNKPVTCSASLPCMDAALANDGWIDSDSYWATDVAGDGAAWWQVDLEQEKAVERVVVVGYYRDHRCYGFTVEGSLDGTKWEMLADRRDNKEPSTKKGYSCAFAPRTVRYLRVTMTANSANTGRHLVEVLAF